MSYNQAKLYFDQKKNTLERELTRNVNPQFEQMIRDVSDWNNKIYRSKSPARRSATKLTVKSMSS